MNASDSASTSSVRRDSPRSGPVSADDGVGFAISFVAGAAVLIVIAAAMATWLNRIG